jgi:phosphopantothenoylcysteine decarboxylase/phosphopantothenate--cysteine ligase
VNVETADQMLAACQAALPADVAVLVAAVADWKPVEAQSLKLKKGQTSPTLALTETPDILASLSKPGAERPRLVIGFAAETHDVDAHARAKLARKGCDWIIANDVSQAGVMGGDENAVTLLSAAGAEAWPKASKAQVAQRLAAKIAQALTE